MAGKGVEGRLKKLERTAVVDSKLTMSTLQTVKALQAVALVNFQTPSDRSLADYATAALRAHGDAIFSVKGHRYGLADVWVWQALTTHVMSQMKNNPPPLTQEQSDFIKKLHEHVQNSTPASLADYVKRAYLT